jgi:hypothetical protein
MKKYHVTNTFKRRYQKKEPNDRVIVENTIKQLIEDPHYPGLHTHKVRGTKHIFEAYIDDFSRLTFQYGDDEIIFRNNCKHDAVLRNP